MVAMTSTGAIQRAGLKKRIGSPSYTDSGKSHFIGASDSPKKKKPPSGQTLD